MSSGTEQLLGSMGAAPLDTGDPVASFFSTEKEIGFWPILKGVTSVAVCVAIYYVLRRCLRHKRANRVKARLPPELRINDNGTELCNSDTASSNTRRTWKVIPSPSKKPVQSFPALSQPVSSPMDQLYPQLPSEMATMNFGNESEDEEDEELSRQLDPVQGANGVHFGSKIDPPQSYQVHSNTPSDHFSFEENPSILPFDLSPQDHTQIHEPESNQLRENDEELRDVSLSFTEDSGDSWLPLDRQSETLVANGYKCNPVPSEEPNQGQIEEASKDEQKTVGVPEESTVVTSSAVVTIH